MFETRTVVVSMLLGTIVTLVASIAPAIKATKVPPIAAVREGADAAARAVRPRTGPPSRSRSSASRWRCSATGCSSDGVATGPRLLSLAVGVLGLFVGVALTASKLARPLASVLGRPFARIGGVSGSLARENAMRNPARTASTAAALMIGLALVTMVATLGKGLDRLRHATRLRHQVRADYVVTSKNGWDPFSRAAGDAAAAAPGVTVASSVRNEQAKVGSDEVRVDGIDPATIASVYHYDWVQGSDATLGIARPRRRDRPAEVGDQPRTLGVGDRITVVNPAGRKARYVVRGIYTQPKFGQIDPVLGSIAISQQAFDSPFDRPQNALHVPERDGRRRAR